jgi:hypothetical protein
VIGYEQVVGVTETWLVSEEADRERARHGEVPVILNGAGLMGSLAQLIHARFIPSMAFASLCYAPCPCFRHVVDAVTAVGSKRRNKIMSARMTGAVKKTAQ